LPASPIAHRTQTAYRGDTRLVWLPDAAPSRVNYVGAPQTIALMGRAAIEGASDFSVRRVVEAFCQGLASKDYTSEYLACYYGLLQHTRYMRDPRTIELVKNPRVIAQQILAGQTPSIDCDELTTMLAAMHTSCGGKAEFVTVAFEHQFFDGRRQFSHVYERVLEPRTSIWIVFDPVAAEKTGEMLSRVKAYEIWPLTT
jgi:hypothetical protein